MNPPRQDRPLRVLAMRPPPAPQTLDMRAFLCTEPLELEYLETVLAPEHEVRLWDGMVEPGDPVALVRRWQPDVVLATGFITSVPTIRQWARRMGQLPRPPLFLVGGPHAEVCPEHFFAPDIHGVFFSDALVGVREALRRYARGEAIRGIPGSAAPRGDGTASDWEVTPGPPLDPNRMPIPRRSRFEADPDRWHYLWYRRCAVVKTAFGCPGRCTFCFCAEQHHGRYGPRPIGQVVEEIAGLRGARSLFLIDDNFLTSEARVREFCRLYRERGLSGRLEIIAYGTADFVARHPEVLKELRDIGLRGLIVGFEFVEDRDLEAVEKPARRRDAEACLIRCRELDIEVFGLFVVDPDWPPERFRNLERQVRHWGVAFATFSTLTAFPGTRLARQSGLDGRDVPWQGWRYDLLHLGHPPRHLNPWQYYAWLLRLHLGPALHPEAARVLRRRAGRVESLVLTARGLKAGAEFFFRLWRYGPVPRSPGEGTGVSDPGTGNAC